MGKCLNSLVLAGILGCASPEIKAGKEQPTPLLIEARATQGFSGLEHNLNEIKRKFPDLESLIKEKNINFWGVEDPQFVEYWHGRNINIKYAFVEARRGNEKRDYKGAEVNIYVGNPFLYKNVRSIDVNDGLTQCRLIFCIEMIGELIDNAVKEIAGAIPDDYLAGEKVEVKSMREALSRDVDILVTDFASLASAYLLNGGSEVPIEIPLNKDGFADVKNVRWVPYEKKYAQAEHFLTISGRTVISLSNSYLSIIISSLVNSTRMLGLPFFSPS